MSESSQSNTESKSGDLRLSSILKTQNDRSKDSESGAGIIRLGILGVPCDLGVLRNGGRAGGALGPSVMREHLKKVGPLYNPEYNIDISNTVLTDFGDIDGWQTLEELHPRLTEKVERILTEKYLPLVVGGGNDQSYRNARGLMNFLGHGNIGVINIDAHLDVRPTLTDLNLAHSGSPFRQLLLDKDFTGRFVEFAVQGHQCSKEHSDFVTEKGGTLIWFSQLRQNGAVETFDKILSSFPSDMPTFVSFDIDSIRSADCPGVSCPAVIGLSSDDALDICFKAGQRKNVALVDFSEFNPKVESYRTGRLLATMIYFFIMGRWKK